MKLIKEVFIKVLQIVVVIAYIYVMLESWDASAAFHNERVTEHRTKHEVGLIERRN